MKIKIFNLAAIFSYVAALGLLAAALLIPNLLCLPFGAGMMAVGLIFMLLYMRG
ncbi:MAG: hypothetical protein ACOX7J_00065 [Bacillota bacterium]|jgi:hypothetical protein